MSKFILVVQDQLDGARLYVGTFESINAAEEFAKKQFGNKLWKAVGLAEPTDDVIDLNNEVDLYKEIKEEVRKVGIHIDMNAFEVPNEDLLMYFSDYVGDKYNKKKISRTALREVLRELFINITNEDVGFSPDDIMEKACKHSLGCCDSIVINYEGKI